MIERVVTGGQTGADRAAFDTARSAGIPIGGWVPRGRWAEDGEIPPHYQCLRETEDADPAVRTRRNVRDSDGTVVWSHGPARGGTALTLSEAHALGRPVLHLDLDRLDEEAAERELRRWLAEVNPTVLNVAGPRASEDPRIRAAVVRILGPVLAEFASPREI